MAILQKLEAWVKTRCLYDFLFLQREATIVYATHIFDGLEAWATHLAYIQDGELRRAEKISDVNELKSSTNLLSVVETWLRAETKVVKKKPVQKNFASSPFFSSRHMAYYRQSLWLLIFSTFVLEYLGAGLGWCTLGPLDIYMKNMLNSYTTVGGKKNLNIAVILRQLL